MSLRLQDAEGDAEPMQSAEVQAEGGMVQLDLPVGTGAGTHDLQVLHLVTKDNGTVAEVVASREVQVEAAKPWLFLEADKPGELPAACAALRSAPHSACAQPSPHQLLGLDSAC